MFSVKVRVKVRVNAVKVMALMRSILPGRGDALWLIKPALSGRLWLIKKAILAIPCGSLNLPSMNWFC